MKIQQIPSVNFGSATLNIVSMADNHGDILGVPPVIKTIQAHSKDIFEKKDSESTKNILAIAGDFYMNPTKKGVLTNPKNTFGDIQHSLLIKLLTEVKDLFNERNFTALYTPGNHCYGGNDGWLYDTFLLKKVPSLNMLISNINPETSPTAAKLMKKNHLVKTQKIIEIPDDKNPDLKNHVLFMGITIPSLYYYPKGLTYTHFYDETPKHESIIGKEDLTETIKLLNSNIQKFKKKYRKGYVVLLSHTGNKISNILAQNVKDINLILNAHDHKDFSTLLNGTQILSHGQNNGFVRGTNIHFDDDGNVSLIKNEKYYTAPYIKAARNDRKLQRAIEKNYKEDLKPLISLEDEIRLSKEFLYSSNIRYQNSILMNLITTAIKIAAQEKYPDIDIVGIPSTIIRSGLRSKPNRTTFNNIDLFDMFKGVDECVSGISKGTIKGKDLIKLVLENVKNNLKSPTRNAIIHWSDIQIDKTSIGNAINNGHKNNLGKYIKVKNPITNEFEEIQKDKNYCILLADKYLIKDNEFIKVPAQIKHKFKNIKEKYDELFKDYINIVDKKVQLTDEIIEKRIL